VPEPFADLLREKFADRFDRLVEVDGVPDEVLTAPAALDYLTGHRSAAAAANTAAVRSHAEECLWAAEVHSVLFGESVSGSPVDLHVQCGLLGDADADAFGVHSGGHGRAYDVEIRTVVGTPHQPLRTNNAPYQDA